MERLVIIDHNNHAVYFDDVTDETLAKYNGEEEAYINDNYGFENYSWDYIISSYYKDCNAEKPKEIDITKSSAATL